MSLLPDYTEIDRLRAEVARLTAELAAVRTGDTCGRQCEGTAYRITARNLQTELAKAELHRDTYREAWQTVAAEIAELRAQEPIAWCDDPVLAGGIGNCASASAKRYWERGSIADRFSAERLKNPLFARPIPAAQAVPDGYVLAPIEPTPEMIEAARSSHEGEAYLPYSLYSAMIAAAPQPPADHVLDAGKTIEKGAQ